MFRSLVICLFLVGCAAPPAAVIAWTTLAAAGVGAAAAGTGAILSVQTIEENKKRDQETK